MNMKRKIVSVLITLCMVINCFSMCFTVGAIDYSLSVNKETFALGEDILVTATGEGNDWAGIYPREQEPGTAHASIYWYYVAKENNISGSEKKMNDCDHRSQSQSAYYGLPAGDYTIYLLQDGGYTIMAQKDITIDASSAVPDADAPGKPTAAYTRKTSEKGIAAGNILLTAAPDSEIIPEYYKINWGDGSGNKLDDFKSFPDIKYTKSIQNFELSERLMIPSAAKTIVVTAVIKKNGNEVMSEPYIIELPKDALIETEDELLFEFQVVSDFQTKEDKNAIENKHVAMAFEDMKNMSPNSKGMIINGDITDNGYETQYNNVMEMYNNAGTGVPEMHFVIGNHDLRPTPVSTAVSRFLSYGKIKSETAYYDEWIEGCHFIYLASEAAGLNATISTKQYEWFEEKILERRDVNRPTFVFLHQGIDNTVAGTLPDQDGWGGVSNPSGLTRILKKYPEVVYFNGHSHWQFDSKNIMYSKNAFLPNLFETSSVGYLWTDEKTGLVGSEGYYIYVYQDKIVLRGRDFANKKWKPSAQFCISTDNSADKQDLQQLTDNCATYEQSDYTKTSFTAFDKAYTNAKEDLANDRAFLFNIQELTKKINALVKVEKPTTPEQTNEASEEITGDTTGDTTNERPSDKFTDLPDNYWGSGVVKKCIDMGIFHGRTKTEFAPDEYMTRAEFVQMLYNYYKDTDVLKAKPGIESNFSDVEKTDYFYEAVTACTKAGIIQGYTDNWFFPDRYVSRQEVAIFMTRILYGDEEVEKLDVDQRINELKSQGITFYDINEYSYWAKKHVIKSIGVIFNGDDGHYLHFSSSIKRAECAQVMYNTINAKK